MKLLFLLLSFKLYVSVACASQSKSPLLSCFFYQELFCLFDPNYQNDENNNDNDVSITATNFLFQVL